VQKLPEQPPSDWNQALTSGNASFAGDIDQQREVAEYNRRYLSWDELKYRIPDTELRKITWAMMKLIRLLQFEQVPFKRLPLTYSFIPGIVKSLHTIDRYLSGTMRIHNKAITFEESYIVNSLMEEAIASSILEGAVTTRKAAKEMLRKGNKPKNDAERMVLNNYGAMQVIWKKKDDLLSPAFICDVHRIVTKETIEEENVLHFRTSNEVIVVDSQTSLVYHIPPDFSEIEGFIEDLCTFANNDDAGNKTSIDTFIHPIIKGIILHYLIGYLHPFNDGNGRTARSIFYWYVLSRGYWLFEYMPISRIILRSRKKYSLAYLHTEYDGSDVTYFLQYNLSCINESLADLLKYLEKQQAVQTTTKAIIRKINEINPRQANIIREMMEHSDEYFTIHQVMQMYNTVYQTARTDLLHLTELGYVIREKRGKEYMFIFNEQSNFWKEATPKKKDFVHFSSDFVN
jgi:Fic family protein